jgi:cytochrome c553
MGRFLKWLGILIGSILGMVILTAAVLVLVGGSKINRRFDIQTETLSIPSNEQVLARGRHLEEAVLDCTFCHGADLAGGVLFDEPGMFDLHAPNLTEGEGGVGALYDDRDWIRAVRHGVDPEGKGLLFMPADVFNQLSAEDLAAVIAYVRSFPPVNGQVPEPDFSPVGRILIALGQLPEMFVMPAQFIDHEVQYKKSVIPAVSAEYGEYLVSIAYCTHCHTKNLSGGPFPFPEPGAPYVPNITSTGAIGGWSAEQFRETMLTGITPYGKVLDAEFMPWGDYKMTDGELEAVWLYLQSLPKSPD